MKETLLNRFIKYVKIDTQSDPESQSYPSTDKQFDLLNLLVDELKEIGMQDVQIDEKGYVTATLPSNSDKKNIPTVAFIAHVDTSFEMSGTNVNPQIINNYDGKDIILDENYSLPVSEFPELENYVGKTIITSDGKTLLGADDKAGVAEIVTAMQYLINNPDIKHGNIKVAFTPDEEIGKGVDYFDVEKFAADYAYTLDGGGVGELEFENFNAASANFTVKGKNIHTGYAKNKMINASIIITEINNMLPANQRPEHTQDYEGFYHLHGMKGNVEEATADYLIRNHDIKEFEKQKQYLSDIAEFLNKKYGEQTVTLTITDSYFNMRSKIEPVYHIIEIAKEAIRQAGVEPIVKPIRGGTDGARLSYMGLPCPNIFAGGHNFHSRFEYVPLESMEKATQVVINIVKLFEQKH